LVFTSHIFLFYFLPCALLVYYLLPFRFRNAFLTLASYLFYGWWMPWFVLLMMTSTVVDYVCAKIISASLARRSHRFAALVTSIVLNLGLLGFFKYYMFAAETLNRLLELFGADVLRVFTVVLPIGISFYTFQTMSYTIDVYRGVAPPVKSFSDFSCFVSLFPQLIAGPIVRYNVVAEQLASRDHTVSKFASGSSLFILGFAKKTLLANPMGEVADAVFSAESLCSTDAWFGILAYAFQIYFDFSGYSDMAIGLGRMLGFEFPKNFNAPYLADSITDFWRRWHISLSTFLRDYLYIPLGGNRKGNVRTYVNLAIVMLLGGLWHGANWVFVAWGLFHGLLLCLERFLGRRSVYNTLPRALRVGMTFVLVLFSWVLFRSPTMTDASGYFASLFGFSESTTSAMLLAAELYTPSHFVVMTLCAALAIQPMQSFEWSGELSWVKVLLLLPLFLLAIGQMFGQAFNPFLYFQF
jgi:alginate O-acetyltransferase complex protein AlgI